MTAFVAALAFLAGLLVGVRVLAALYGPLDLWYTIGTAWPVVVRRIAVWGAVAVGGLVWLDGAPRTAFAAELGSMKIAEEIDALTTLGISPVDHLVLPRVLGLFVMMPLLVIYADIVGIAGGMGIAVAMLDVTPTQFTNGLLTAVVLSDALLGVFKAIIFGAIIGIAGCMKGLQAGSDAGAVGRAATSAVVVSITLVIFANAVVDWLAALLLI